MSPKTKHDMYFEMKHFPKVDIEQINISTVNGNQVPRLSMRSAPFARKSRKVYIFVYITNSVFYLISNHIFVYINHLEYVLFLYLAMFTHIYQVNG